MVQGVEELFLTCSLHEGLDQNRHAFAPNMMSAIVPQIARKTVLVLKPYTA